MADRSERIEVRVTPAEKKELERKAELYGLSVSAYLRAAGLQRTDQRGTAAILARTVGADPREQGGIATPEAPPKPKGPVSRIFEGKDG